MLPTNGGGAYGHELECPLSVITLKSCSCAGIVLYQNSNVVCNASFNLWSCLYDLTELASWVWTWGFLTLWPSRNSGRYYSTYTLFFLLTQSLFENLCLYTIMEYSPFSPTKQNVYLHSSAVVNVERPILVRNLILNHGSSICDSFVRTQHAFQWR